MISQVKTLSQCAVCQKSSFSNYKEKLLLSIQIDFLCQIILKEAPNYSEGGYFLKIKNLSLTLYGKQLKF